MTTKFNEYQRARIRNLNEKMKNTRNKKNVKLTVPHFHNGWFGFDKPAFG